MSGKIRILGSATAALFALASAPQAQADQFEDSGFYVGGAYGMVTADGDDFDDDNDYSNLFAGYQILPFLGIEGGYYDFGEYGNSVIRADVESWSLAVTGRLPLSQSLALFARLGPVWSESELTSAGYSANQDSEEVLFGAGVSFQVAENLDLRVSYDWVDQDLDANDIEGAGTGDFNADLNMLSAGLKIEF